MAVVALFFDSSEREQVLKDERLHVIERLSAMRARLEAAINIPVSTSRAIAVIYAAHPDMSGHEFASLAAQAKAFSPSITNIALFRDTTVSHVYPLEGNEKLIGLDFRKLPLQWPTYQHMMTTRQPVLAGPLQLVQRRDAEAVVVRIPVYRTDDTGNEHFIGSVGTPFLFASLLREAGLPDIEQTLHVAMRGRDGKGSGGEVFYGAPKVFAMDPIIQSDPARRGMGNRRLSPFRMGRRFAVALRHSPVGARGWSAGGFLGLWIGSPFATAY